MLADIVEKPFLEYAEHRVVVEVQKRFEAIALPRDGKDGRDGRDGVDGKDGAPGNNGADGKDGDPGLDGAPGRDGIDGMSVEDFFAEVVEDRVVRLGLRRGDVVKSADLYFPIVIDRGIYTTEKGT
jgi:hypothetical protein